MARSEGRRLERGTTAREMLADLLASQDRAMLLARLQAIANSMPRPSIRVERGLLWRHIEDVRREFRDWTWERLGREVNRRMEVRR